MQVFAAAMVQWALREVEARIAQRESTSPADLSAEKLYPRVACVTKTVVEAELYFDKIEEANRRKLKKPD